MIGDNDLSIPAKMLDLYALKHKLIAQNIANADVPGFHKLTASFGKELERAIESKDPARIREVEAKIETARHGGVDPDAEIAGMAKNEVLFQAFSEIASYRLRMLRAAMK